MSVRCPVHTPVRTAMHGQLLTSQIKVFVRYFNKYTIITIIDLFLFFDNRFEAFKLIFCLM